MSAGTGRQGITTIAIVGGFIVAACVGGAGPWPGSSPTPSEIATGVPDLPTQGAAPTLEPSPTPPPPSPTPLPPSPVPELPSPTPAGPSPCDNAHPAPTPRPPDDARITGRLVIPGSDGILGVLGSATLDGVGSDSPWLPFAAGRMVPIPVDVPVTIEFGDGAAIDGWSASLADANDREALGLIGVGYRESGLAPLGEIRLEPLPAGCWVLAASLSRADGRGRGVTYWSISVSSQE